MRKALQNGYATATAVLCSMAAIFFIITAFSFHFNIQPQNTVHFNVASSETAASGNGAATVYVIREYRGRIGVFVQGGASPVETVPVALRSLPRADAALIRNGVVLHGDAALRLWLEDYES